MRAISAGVLLVTALLLAGCEGGPKVSDTDIQQLSYKDLLDLMGAKQGPTVLVDVRPPRRFEAEHIPGAINIPLPEIVASDARLADARNIVVYAGDWNGSLSPAAAKKMVFLHYANVYDYRGGLRNWRDEGGRTEGSNPATRPAR